MRSLDAYQQCIFGWIIQDKELPEFTASYLINSWLLYQRQDAYYTFDTNIYYPTYYSNKAITVVLAKPFLILCITFQHVTRLASFEQQTWMIHRIMCLVEERLLLLQAIPMNNFYLGMIKLSLKDKPQQYNARDQNIIWACAPLQQWLKLEPLTVDTA